MSLSLLLTCFQAMLHIFHGQLNILIGTEVLIFAHNNMFVISSDLGAKILNLPNASTCQQI